MSGKRLMKAISSLVLAGALSIGFIGARAQAAENQPAPAATKAPNPQVPKVRTIRGHLAVTKDATGNITEAILHPISGKKAIKIALDEQGKKLATEMADKMVLVKGTVKKGEITVASFKLLPPKPTAGKPAKPETKPEPTPAPAH